MLYNLIPSLTEQAIELMKLHQPVEGYYLAFSGGKDSCVLYDLADKGNINFESHFNYTTLDPPELLKFVHKNYPGTIKHKPKLSMFKLIVKQGIPPSRKIRYCCNTLKESGGKYRMVLTGIRSDESPSRSKRPQLELSIYNKIFLHPLLHWDESNVWDYIDQNNLPYCELYNIPGYDRIGCIGCPLISSKLRTKEFQRYPQFYKAFMKAFTLMLKSRTHSNWKSPQDVMNSYLT